MINREIKSFNAALTGLSWFFRKEPHAIFHFVALIAVTGAGFYFGLSDEEWIGVLVAFGLVVGTEALNTAIEKLCDFVHAEQNDQIKRVKDVAAGAVLFNTVIAIIIACIIFIPKIF